MIWLRLRAPRCRQADPKWPASAGAKPEIDPTRAYGPYVSGVPGKEEQMRLGVLVSVALIGAMGCRAVFGPQPPSATPPRRPARPGPRRRRWWTGTSARLPRRPSPTGCARGPTWRWCRRRCSTPPTRSGAAAPLPRPGGWARVAHRRSRLGRARGAAGAVSRAAGRP
jgi:hypothetical protein